MKFCQSKRSETFTEGVGKCGSNVKNKNNKKKHFSGGSSIVFSFTGTLLPEVKKFYYRMFDP
jgi:hypothetical protein